MDVTLDETRLERLEDDIEREEASVGELRLRTRAVEAEAATWPAPRGIPGPFQVAAERSRALEEVFLGLVSGWLLVTILATFWLGGRL